MLYPEEIFDNFHLHDIIATDCHLWQGGFVKHKKDLKSLVKVIVDEEGRRPTRIRAVACLMTNQQIVLGEAVSDHYQKKAVLRHNNSAALEVLYGGTAYVGDNALERLEIIKKETSERALGAAVETLKYLRELLT